MHIQFNPYGALVLHPETEADKVALNDFKAGKVSLGINAANAEGNVRITAIPQNKPTFKLESTPVPNNKNTKPCT
jgi:hypothetical protein